MAFRWDIAGPVVATVVVGAVALMATVPMGDATSHIATWLPFLSGVQHADLIAYGVAFCIGAVAVWWWALLRKPAQKASPAHGALALAPDFPLQRLFKHIDPEILRNPHRSPEQSVGIEIMDKLATGQLHGWGRNGDIANGPMVPIARDYWETAKWTHMFHGEEDFASLLQVEPITKYGSSYLGGGYRDVQVNKAEALGLWPASKVTALPDYRGWDKKDPLEVYAAACLWADEEPMLPLPSSGAETVYRRLGDLWFDHKISISHGEETADIVRGITASMRTKLVDPHATIERVELKKAAELLDEKPRFLFSRERVFRA